MMEWIGAVILLLVALAGALQVSVLWKARKMEGKLLPDLNTDSAIEALNEVRMLFYFHSPGCAPCRRMSPIVNALAAKHRGVVSVDITRDTETARKFGIRATPTSVLVENGTIVKVLLGFQSEEKLTGMLEPAKAAGSKKDAAA